MRRSILHPKCVSEPVGVGSDSDPLVLAEIIATGEETRRVTGPALRGLYCDHCGEAIAPGEAVTAESTYTHARPYFEWEHEYIKGDRT